MKIIGIVLVAIVSLGIGLGALFSGIFYSNEELSKSFTVGDPLRPSTSSSPILSRILAILGGILFIAFTIFSVIYAINQ